MAEAIIFEVKGVNEDLYHTVNANLGIDKSGKGDWPDGLISHTGALQGDSIVVFEVWESRAKQEAYMNSQLGPAMGKAGVPEPNRMEWFTVIGQNAG